MTAELISVPLPLHDPNNLDHILPELRPLARDMSILIPDPENARKHDLRNLSMIAESLTLFGQRVLLVVNRQTNYITKGNGTYMAAKMLGWTKIAWVWTDDERTAAVAFGLVDNRTSDTSTTDYAQTGDHLKELQASDFPMSQFWTPEEAMPLLRQTFEAPALSDEKFDVSLQKGRAIKGLSASHRIQIDRAIAFVRSKSPKAMSEGDALFHICGEFMALHVNEIDNRVEEEIKALSLEDI